MRRRGFTILETVLAATLAAIVVLGCMGAFLALNRTDRALAGRFEEANDLARIQRTMQRAFTSLLLSEESPLDDELELGAEEEEGEEEQGEQPQDDPEAEDEALDEPVQIRRIALEPDLDPTLTSMISRARYGAGGGGSSVAAPQRLELVLSAVPIRPPSVQSTAWAAALVGVEDLQAQELAEAEGAEEYSGVHGAFVLRPDDPTGDQATARAAREDDRVGWTLWWQPLDDRSEPARVASGLAACSFQMFHGREMLSDLVAYNAAEMPTYIQLEVETLSGLYANYLFEVVWTVDEYEAETEQAAGEGGNGDGGDGGEGGGLRGGALDGGRGGGGGRGRTPEDGRQGRPKALTPQGAGPASEVDGRPTRQGDGGGRGGGR